MPFHPCADGLTPVCFKAYPAWARQALAYKLLHILLPKQLTKNLPGGLNLPFVAPGVIIPPGVEFTPGTVIPPDVSFPPGWTPADAAPPGVIITPEVYPTPPGSGAAPPIYIQPFEPGPVHTPAPGPGLIEYTVEFLINSTEWLGNYGTPWATVRDYVINAAVAIPTISPYPSITAYNQGSYYDLWRFAFKFDLSALPPGASMVSGYVSIKVSTGTGKTCCVQRSPTITWNNKNDYLAFTGAAEDPKTISGVEQKFALSADSLAYCKAQAGSFAYFIAREDAHDFLNSAPTAGQRFEAQFYTHADSNPALRPTLTLVYKA